MNIIDILILVMLGISVVFGLYRGFMQSVISLAGVLLSLLAAYFFAPQLAAFLGANKGVASMLSTYTDAGSLVGDLTVANLSVSGIGANAIQTVLQNVSLPEPIADILRINLSTEAFASAGLTTVNEYVSGTVVAIALQVLSFLLCFAAGYIAISFLANLISHIMDLPVLKQLDALAGGAFGLLRGILFVYILFLLIPLLSTVVPVEGFTSLFETSELAGLFESEGLFRIVTTGL